MMKHPLFDYSIIRLFDYSPIPLSTSTSSPKPPNLQTSKPSLLTSSLLLLTSSLLAPLPSLFAAILPQRIVPNKIVYAENEKGWADVTFTNDTASAQTANFIVEERWGVVGEGREIFRGSVSLEPNAAKKVRVDYPGSNVRYGHEIKVQVEGCKLNVAGRSTPNSQLSTRSRQARPSRSEFFSVNDDWWRVCQGMDAESRRRTKDFASPQAARFCRWYGYDPEDWYRSTAPKHGSLITWRCRLPDLGPFQGYGNLQTIWQLKECSVGGNYLVTQYAPNEKWYANGNMERTNAMVLEDLRVSHERGYRHTLYTIPFLENHRGFEIARQKPHFVLRDRRGQFSGHYNQPDVDPLAISKFHGFYPGWAYVEANFFRKDTLDWALEDLKRQLDAYGEDGVYFDGRYVQHAGYDCFGNDYAKTCDVDASIRYNMKRTREVLLERDPQRFIWSNGGSFVSENTLLDHPRSGLLDETQWDFLLHPTMGCNNYRGLLDSMLHHRNTCYLPGPHAKRPSKIYIVGYLSSCWQPQIGKDFTREQWTMCNHVMALLCSVLAHPWADSFGMRPYKQMLTRYSEFYWHEDIEIMRDGYKRFLCDSLREVWYDDMIYKRETKDYTDYYIHLCNTPEKEMCDQNVREDPPEVDDAEISTKLFGTEGVKAWAIQPYGYASPRLEPTCVALSVKSVKDETVIAIPPFTYYTLVVIRVKK